MGPRFLLSSDSLKQHRSFTSVLASALLEWLLIIMLFVYGFFGYLITKFASYCELPIPCLLCSRIDHILGSEKVGFCRDMICGDHKMEISSLVYCHFHEKLVDVRGMCESCLFSFATKDKSNAETYRLLVGKLGGEDLGGVDDEPLTDDLKTKSSNMKHCCCCNELWTARCHAQTLFQTKSTGFDDTDLDMPLSRGFSQDLTGMKMELKSLHPFADVGRKTEESLVHFGYTELKVTSDTESDIQMSDAEDLRALISNDPLRDLILDSTPTKSFTAVSDDEPGCDKPDDLDPSSEPSEKLYLVKSDIIDPPNNASVSPAVATIGHGLEELNWQEIDNKLDPSPSTDLEAYNVLESPDNGNASINLPINGSNVDKAGVESEKVDAKDSSDVDIKEAEVLSEKVDVKDSKDLDIKEAGVMQTLEPVAEKTPELERLQIPTDLNSLNTRSEIKDGGLQIPNQLELGDAYKLAISSKGRQFSGKLVEQLTGKESPRVSADLKLLLSQLSRGSEFPFNDILSPSPRLSRNLDDFKTNDLSSSIGMKLLQKRLSLERNDSKSSLDRNESGFDSLDFSTVSEIEGESEFDQMKRQLEHDKKFLIALLKELEEERNASASAANEAMAMITRLQEEKAALQMEASHDLRMMEEQAEYDMEALDKLNELLTEKEKEIQDLEAELEYYRTKYPNESFVENVGESAPNVEESDKIGGDPNNLNALAGDVKSNSKIPRLEIENERKHILERLNSLKKKLNAFCCNKVCFDLTDGDQNGKDSCDMKWPEEGQIVEIGIDGNGVMPEKVESSLARNGQDQIRRMHSFKRSKSTGAEQGTLMLKEAEILALVKEVSSLSERLEALEADHFLIERSIDTLKNGEEVLIQEIASHLRELRKIGIKRYGNPLER